MGELGSGRKHAWKQSPWDLSESQGIINFKAELQTVPLRGGWR